MFTLPCPASGRNRQRKLAISPSGAHLVFARWIHRLRLLDCLLRFGLAGRAAQLVFTAREPVAREISPAQPEGNLLLSI
jgi:hypothetical protein